MTAVEYAEIPVGQLRPGDVVYLPSGRPVDVERIDRLEDGRLIVRWADGPSYPAGHPLAGQRRQLGSLTPKTAGAPVRAARQVQL